MCGHSFCGEGHGGRVVACVRICFAHMHWIHKHIGIFISPTSFESVIEDDTASTARERRIVEISQAEYGQQYEIVDTALLQELVKRISCDLCKKRVENVRLRRPHNSVMHVEYTCDQC
ncbi:unnamed protein product, partial [Sphagnum balticum]